MIRLSLDTILSHRGYSVPLKDLSEEEIRKHKHNLTVIPYVEKEEYSFGVKPVKLYTLSTQRMYMPRYYGLKHFGKPKQDKLTTKEFPILKNLETILKPRDHQIPIMKKVLKDLEEVYGGVISIYCGGGKTALAIMIACTLKIKTLVVCHTTSLMRQWVDRIKEFVPNANIGIVQQSTTEIEDKDFIVSSLSSISQKEYPKDTFSSVGLVVWDEIHLMCTNLFSKAFTKLTTKYSVGLSATPHRRDKCEVIFENHIGDILYTLKREKDEEIIVECVKILIPPEDIPIVNDRRGKIQYTTTVTRLMYLEARTNRIVDMIIGFARRGRKVLVLSEYIQHLRDLKTNIIKKIKELRLNPLYENNDKYQKSLNFTYDLYIGEMKSGARKNTEQKDVILGTYKLASVGMDIPKLNTLILASPRKEIEQSVGRILRKDKSSKVQHKPLVVDIIDNHGIFVSQSNVRKKFYKKYGYTIHHIQMELDGRIKSKRIVPTIKQEETNQKLDFKNSNSKQTKFGKVVESKIKSSKMIQCNDDDEEEEILECLINDSEE